MADPRRIKRLEKLLYQAIAPLIAHGLSDPRLGMVTVTRIRLSRDLSIARVNWSTLGGEADRSKAAHALEDARGPLQAAVAQSMQTRTTPRLIFHYDESMEGAARVHDILHQLAEERRARGGEEEESEPEETRPEAEDGDAS